MAENRSELRLDLTSNNSQAISQTEAFDRKLEHLLVTASKVTKELEKFANMGQMVGQGNTMPVLREFDKVISQIGKGTADQRIALALEKNRKLAEKVGQIQSKLIHLNEAEFNSLKQRMDMESRWRTERLQSQSKANKAADDEWKKSLALWQGQADHNKKALAASEARYKLEQKQATEASKQADKAFESSLSAWREQTKFNKAALADSEKRFKAESAQRIEADREADAQWQKTVARWQDQAKFNKAALADSEKRYKQEQANIVAARKAADDAWKESLAQWRSQSTFNKAALAHSEAQAKAEQTKAQKAAEAAWFESREKANALKSHNQKALIEGEKRLKAELAQKVTANKAADEQWQKELSRWRSQSQFNKAALADSEKRLKTELAQKQAANKAADAEWQKTVSRWREQTSFNQKALAASEARLKNERRVVEQERKTREGPSRANQMVLNRLDANGGADFVRIQSRILNNFLLIGAAYGSMAYLTQFVYDLDRALHDFQAITASSASEMENLENRLISVSEQTKFSALEVTEAATVMAQAGLSTSEIEKSIDAVALLATATGTDMKSSVDVVTSVLGVFNLQATETTQLVNVMTGAINESKLTMDKLALGLQYAGNIAAQAGITYTELTAILGGMANAGIRSGSTLGTGIRQLLLEIQAPTEKFKERLGQLGLNENDVNVTTQTFVGVMKNLAEAGFTAADAMDVFEVRTAAAFSAISNNVDQIVELERGLLLSDAAAKANNVQMKALANTFEKFKSVAGTVAYNAFKPMVGFLQQFTNGLANLMSKLNAAPDMLGLIGSLLAGLITTALIAKLGRLTAGFLNLTAALKALQVVAGGASGAMTKTQIAMSLLRGGAVVVLGLALGYLIDKFGATARGLEGIDAALDKSDEKIHGFEGRIESATSTLTAIDEAVHSLAQQSVALSEDQDLLNNRILEAQGRFAEYGIKIDNTTSSIEELISAYQTLREEQANIQFAELTGLLGAQQERIELEKQRLHAEAMGEVNNTYNKVFDIYDVPKPVVPESVSAGGAETTVPFIHQAVNSQMSTLLNDLVGPMLSQAILDVLGHGVDIESLNRSDVGYALGSANSERQALINEATLLEANGGDASDIRKKIEALTVITKSLNTVYDHLGAVELATMERDQTQFELGKNAVQRDDKFKTAMEMRDRVTQQISEGLDEILDKNLGEQELVDALTAFEKEITPWINMLQGYEDLLKVDESLKRKIGKDNIDKEVDALGMTTEAAELRSALLKPGIAAREALNKVLEESNKRMQDRIEAEIKTLEQEASEAVDPNEVEAIRENINKLYSDLTFLRDKVITDYSGLDPNGTAMDDRRFTSSSEVEQTRLQSMNTLNEYLERLHEGAYKLEVGALKQRSETIQREMALLEDRMARQTTEAGRADIRAQFEAKGRELEALTQQIAEMENVSTLTGVRGKTSSAAAGPIQSRIITEANRRGIDPQVALAIAHFESGFNPTAQPIDKKTGKPRSSAFGIFQFIDSTWETTGFSKSANPDIQIPAGVEYLVQARDKLEKILGRQPTIEEFYLAQLWGHAGAANFLKAGKDERAFDVLSRMGNKNPGKTLSDNGLGLEATVGDMMNKFAGHIQKSWNEVSQYLEGGLNMETYNTAVSQDVAGVVQDIHKRSAKLLETSLKGRMEQIEKEFAIQQAALGLDIASLGNRQNRDRIGPIQSQAMEEQLEIKQEEFIQSQINLLKQEELKTQKELTQAKQAGNATLAEQDVLQDHLNNVLARRNELEAEYTALTHEVQEMGLMEMMEAGINQWGRSIGLFKGTNETIVGGMLNTLDSARNGFKGLFSDIAFGSKSAGEAFRDFGLSVLETMANIAIEMATNKLFEMLLGTGLNLLGGAFGGGFTPSAVGSSWAPSAGANFLPPVYHSGGMIGSSGVRKSINPMAFAGAPRFHVGGEIPIIAQQGEFMLRKQAVDLIGRGTLDRMNRHPDLFAGRPSTGQDTGQQVVNVWVVSKDNVPPPGPKDIVAAVVDSGRKGGPVKQLIKSVMMGQG